MPKSELVFRLARRHPRLAATITGWAARWRLLADEEAFLERRSWLLNHLIDQLYVRIPRRATLSNGMTMLVPCFDEVGDRIVEHGVYEGETIELLQHLVEPGMVAIDAGAHAGFYTLHLSKLVGSTGAVHSFEAEPALARMIARNLSANGRRNVVLTTRVLSQEDGTVSFYTASAGCVNSLMEPRSIYEFQVSERPSINLDTYLTDNGITRVDLIKMDIEGAELAVLETIGDRLRSTQRPMLIVEFAQSRTPLAALAGFLIDCGYDLYRIGSYGLTSFDDRRLEQWIAEHDGLFPAFNVFAVSQGTPSPRLTKC